MKQNMIIDWQRSVNGIYLISQAAHAEKIPLVLMDKIIFTKMTFVLIAALVFFFSHFI